MQAVQEYVQDQYLAGYQEYTQGVQARRAQGIQEEPMAPWQWRQLPSHARARWIDNRHVQQFDRDEYGRLQAGPEWVHLKGQEHLFNIRSITDASFLASPSLAGGKVYLLSDKGVMYILTAGDEYKELARCELGEEVHACPAFVDGRIRSREEQGMTHDGQAIDYLVHIVPVVRPNGDIPYVIEMSTDITPVKRLEKEKREAERLAAVGETVAGVAHGIKNILMGLEGGMYAVNTGIRTDDDERIARGWTMLEDNVRRIVLSSHLSWVSEDLSWLERSRGSPEPGAAPPNYQVLVAAGRYPRAGGEARIVWGPVKFETYAKFNDWGPYDYHKDFNLTFPEQLLGDLSYSFGKPALLFGVERTKLGVRATWRSLDRYSPRYCPDTVADASGTPVCDPLAPGTDGEEWEIRTYLHFAM